MRNYALGLCSILLLAACTPDFSPPEPIDFESDPRILRGEWTGEVASASATPQAYSPDGARLLVVEAFDATIYDTQAFDVVAELALDEAEFVDTAQFSPNAEVLATTRREAVDEEAFSVSLWNARTGERLQTSSSPFKGYFEGFSTNLERLATISFIESTIEIWDVSSESRLSSFPVPEEYSDFLVSPDLTTVAALRLNDRGKEVNYTVTLWNLATRAVMLETTVDAQSLDYDTFLFSPDGSLLAISYGQGDNSTTDIYDVAAGEFLLSSGKVAGGPLAFSGDNQRLATKPACSSCVRVLDARTGRTLAEAEFDVPIPQAIYGIQFSPQLGQAARVSGGRLLVTDFNSGDVLADVVPAGPLSMRLDLEAVYIGTASYDVSGTLEYTGETYTVKGKVLGGGDQTYLKPMTSPLPEASFDINALDAQGDVRWTLEGPPPYDDSPKELTLDGSLRLPQGVGPVHYFFLKRQP